MSSSQMSMQIVYQLLVLSVVMTMAVSRPQNGIENMWNQESAENLPSLSDLLNLQKFYTSYRMAAGPNGFMGVEESSPIDRLPKNVQLPETKRQVRYRQCYFNPISCFKK